MDWSRWKKSATTPTEKEREAGAAGEGAVEMEEWKYFAYFGGMFTLKILGAFFLNYRYPSFYRHYQSRKGQENLTLTCGVPCIVLVKS